MRLLDHPELVPAVLLVAVLLTLGVAFVTRIARMGDEVGARLDALDPGYELASLAYAKSADLPPLPVPPLGGAVSVYATLVGTLGIDPLGDS